MASTLIKHIDSKLNNTGLIARHRRRSVNTPLTSPDSEETNWLRCANIVTTAPICVNNSVQEVECGQRGGGSVSSRGGIRHQLRVSHHQRDYRILTQLFLSPQSRARGFASECAQRASSGGRQERQPRGQEKQPGRGRGPVQVRPCTSDQSGLRQSENIQVSTAYLEQRYQIEIQKTLNLCRRGSTVMTEQAIPENVELLFPSAVNLATRRKSAADLLENRFMENKFLFPLLINP